MIVATTLEIPGRKISEMLGVVQGNSVCARAVGRDFVTGLRNLVGGGRSESTRSCSLWRERKPSSA